MNDKQQGSYYLTIIHELKWRSEREIELFTRDQTTIELNDGKQKEQDLQKRLETDQSKKEYHAKGYVDKNLENVCYMR